MRAMREILPPMDVVEGLPFNPAAAAFNADPERCVRAARGRRHGRRGLTVARGRAGGRGPCLCLPACLPAWCIMYA